MPYDSISDLPDNVRNNLPSHAQEIYRKTFNSAGEEYRKPEDRRNDSDREETSHRVAWSAVKKEYHKDGEKWVRETTKRISHSSGYFFWLGLGGFMDGFVLHQVLQF